ncbi:MAG: hypothetical protein EAZ73_09305 [Oscillatoriales cyanobacterium]|uniref:hypothetical protein n=1 Tax=unclassified Microcoleus TaxID=2642155 RepID=UPI001DA95F6D|nr:MULTISPECIES: hypothetical protein [unclassified Microcoleus]TAF00829.1 MAG: hypothetical protein EAZ79_01290 [Oscillatoriales cyanobacterium]MCC3459834.1 hypothetical protein [Microcoleus sp. PH2017_11_PCY_U_A]MCC3478267.1 hypothetical protein [Microcoleus sp. PH2017_12_PCY_D_A]TAF21412.1 MAG: hypothetical protein EAZ73_09305 [Oscillatoriales cyanobacterium]TAF39661.1 MAG: hypothetical protein EAZ69_00040 [Oscillatoriales cyanobacterium]
MGILNNGDSRFIDRWEVFEVILPKIDASGGYIMPTATSEQLSALIKKANVRWRNYNQSSDRDWTRDELEEWIRVNFRYILN